MIKIEPHNGVSNTSDLVLTAKAGNYYIEFYPYGAYKSESEKTFISPTVINLTVYAGFGNFDKTILVNDGYNLAEAINRNTSDFIDYFVFPTIVSSSGGDA